MIDRLIIVPQAESTQDLAREMALRDEPEGVAVMALKQTGGRGRENRVWVSPPGKNVALSLLLRPDVDPADAPLLGLMASIAVAETVEGCGVGPVRLKWPNDVLVAGSKIAGILSEGTILRGQIAFVIIGLGLNVNAEESDFPVELRDSVTSLSMSTGKTWELEAVARQFMRQMDALYDRVRREGCRFIVPLWELRWAHRGQALLHNGTACVAEAIHPDGSLLLRIADGRLLSVRSGEADVPPVTASR
ncbi:MAG: biotin--[acetyl-CoA-carboxylase] ligase [Desulfomonile tiedjei]|nr:biotin--[acetyl-CoA-carboxylase] ligase [Desulfomonile tiedjei]